MCKKWTSFKLQSYISFAKPTRWLSASVRSNNPFGASLERSGLHFSHGRATQNAPQHSPEEPTHCWTRSWLSFRMRSNVTMALRAPRFFTLSTAKDWVILRCLAIAQSIPTPAKNSIMNTSAMEMFSQRLMWNFRASSGPTMFHVRCWNTG